MFTFDPNKTMMGVRIVLINNLRSIKRTGKTKLDQNLSKRDVLNLEWVDRFSVKQLREN